jgi:hypothetical protein
MRILDGSGDTVVEWTAGDVVSTAEAAELFLALQSERKLAFARSIGPGGGVHPVQMVRPGRRGDHLGQANRGRLSTDRQQRETDGRVEIAGQQLRKLEDLRDRRWLYEIVGGRGTAAPVWVLRDSILRAAGA